MQETGTNLLDKAFEQVTDEQITAFHLKTGKQRMDSTQVASNIRQMGRVQLLVEVLQRVQRMLSEADQERYADGKPVKVTCPQGQTVSVHTTSQQKAFVAHFEPSVCQTCPLVERCPARAGKRDERHHLRFTQSEAQPAERRRRSREHLQEGRNLRAAVEATVRSVKHPFPAGKLPVRGRFRVACLVIGSAAVANLRRIHRYLQAKMGAEEQQKKASEGRESAQKGAASLFFLLPKTSWQLSSVGCSRKNWQ